MLMLIGVRRMQENWWNTLSIFSNGNMGEEYQNAPIFYWAPSGTMEELNIELGQTLSTKDDYTTEAEWNDAPSWTGTWTGTVSIDGNDTVYKNIMRLFKHRLPRKFKKSYKKHIAQRIGIPADKLRFSNPCWFRKKFPGL